MLKFRTRQVAARPGLATLRLRTIDALHGLMLTMICLTAAIVLNDEAGEKWSKLVRSAFGPAASESTPPQPVLAVRIAPAAPGSEQPLPPTAPAVRLTLIEDDVDTRVMALPASMTGAPPRHASAPADESSPTSDAAHRPFRAALGLGDQAARTSRN